MEPCRVFGRVLNSAETKLDVPPCFHHQAAVSSSGWGGDDEEVNHFSYLQQVIYPGK